MSPNASPQNTSPPSCSPLVSIIIPAYNAAETISRALDSVRAQTYRNLEVVVINDGSTDETAAIIRREYPEVRHVLQENAGPCVARNHGAQVATGEYIAFLDADDEYHPRKIERQLEIFEKTPDVSVCGTNGVIIHGQRVYPFNNPARPHLIDQGLRELIWGVHPVLASLMLRRDTFLEIGGYDASMKRWEDQDIFYRLAGCGHKVVELNEPLYIIHRVEGSRVTHAAVRRAEWAVRTMLPWNPDREDTPCSSPLDRRTWAYVLGDRAIVAAAECYREGGHEKAREILSMMDDALDRPAPIHAALRRLAKLSWPLFGAAAGLWRHWRSIERGYVRWGGLTGAVRQVYRRYIRNAEGDPSRWR